MLNPDQTVNTLRSSSPPLFVPIAYRTSIKITATPQLINRFLTYPSHFQHLASSEHFEDLAAVSSSYDAATLEQSSKNSSRHFVPFFALFALPPNDFFKRTPGCDGKVSDTIYSSMLILSNQVGCVIFGHRARRLVRDSTALVERGAERRFKTGIKLTPNIGWTSMLLGPAGTGKGSSRTPGYRECTADLARSPRTTVLPLCIL